jgi:hypothetical protein
MNANILNRLRLRPSQQKSNDNQPNVNVNITFQRREALSDTNQDDIYYFMKFLYQRLGIHGDIGLLERDYDENNGNKFDGNRYIIKDNTIGNAEKIGIQIELIQMGKEEKNQVEKDNDEKIPKTKKRKKPTVKRNRKSKIVTNYDNIDDDDELMRKFSNYLEGKPQIKLDHILNNKIGFLNEIKKLTMNLNVIKDDASCDMDKDKEFKPLIHQQIVKRYLNSYTPYRGLLLFHGLGSGKTCTSIGVIEGLKHQKKVFILTPASLQKNYKTQMKFCGDQIFKENNYWVQEKVPTGITEQDKSKMKTLRRITGFTENELRRSGVVYLVDKTEKTSNYHQLSRTARDRISRQIDAMIDRKFEFINYNGITSRTWNGYYKKGKDINPFNNSVIIIDEAHNFVSRVINKLNKNQNSVSTDMYNSILSAENLNIVMLTGTPMINYPCELGVLFNMLGGYNYCVTVELDPKSRTKHKKDYLKKLFESESSVDYIEFTSRENTFHVIKNPYGFIKKENDKIVYDMDNENAQLYMEDFKKMIEEKISFEKDIHAKNIEINTFKKFPDTEKTFNKVFISPNGKLKNREYFQTKIMGMVSYLGDKKELMPRLIIPDNSDETNEDIFIERIPMNEHVYMKYREARALESKMDMNKKKAQGPNSDAVTSSYRVFSRSVCNFAFPTAIQRPRKLKKDNEDEPEMVDEDDLEVLDIEYMRNHNDGKYDDKDIQEFQKKQNENLEFLNEINKVMEELSEGRSEYFSSDLDKFVSIEENKQENDEDNAQPNLNNLATYGPKYYNMLKHLIEDSNVCNLMYSNFRTLEGIGIFKLVLDYYGYTQFKLVKTDGVYEIDFSHPYYDEHHFTERKFYALYTGTETVEEKEIIRNIYNSNLDAIPMNIKQQIISFHRNFQKQQGKTDEQIGQLDNKHGDIINLLIISASGAEGIDLKNVRNVHILEPYWHPVRIDQVIGRARRICSHKDLPKEEQDVSVYLYMMVHNPEVRKGQGDKETTTTDEQLYQISKDKKELSNSVLTLLKEVAIDCLMNYDDKRKCMTIPFGKKDEFKVLNKLEYENDAKKKIRASGEKAKMRFLKMKLQKNKDDEGEPKNYAVDVNSEPYRAYDYKLLNNFNQLVYIGDVVVDKENNRKYLA